LKGWLLLPALGTCLSPFFLGYALYQDREFIDPTVWSGIGSGTEHAVWLQTAFGMTISLGILLLVGSIACIYLMFAKQRRFPMAYIALTWTALVWAAATLALANILDGDQQEVRKTVTTIVRELFAAIIWTAYMLTSQRVKATFTQGSVRQSTGDSMQPSAAPA
jgi:intracellular septation protein A